MKADALRGTLAGGYAVRPTVEGAERDPRARLYDALYSWSEEFRLLIPAPAPTGDEEKIDAMECLDFHAASHKTMRRLAAEWRDWRDAQRLDSPCRHCGAPSNVGQSHSDAAAQDPQGASGPRRA